MHYITLGEKRRPIAFSMRMQYEHETRLKRSFVGDLVELTTLAEVVATGAAVGDTLHVVLLTEIVYSALVAGHNRDKQDVDFGLIDVVGWIDDASPEVVSSIVSGIMNNQAMEKEKTGAKKKPAPRRN